MSALRPLRKIYIKSTNLTHGYQGQGKKLVSFYRVWSSCYDFSVKLDPAFRREMREMIGLTVKPGDTTLDIGCGTGISTFYASETADKVIGIDMSADMIRKLKQKISRRKSVNIEVVHGSFPEALPPNSTFDSIISSFAIVHFTPEERKNVYQRIYDILLSNGRLGLFSAQGEIAPSFETKDELLGNLESAGFKNIKIDDVSDIYRIVRVEKE